jgi:hypothetical protein
MELLDIIFHFLRFFTFTSIFVLTVSYTVFKFKDRNRIKPYMVPFQPAANNDNENAEVSEKPVKLRKTGRFKILNEKNDFTGNPSVSDEQFFKVDRAEQFYKIVVDNKFEQPKFNLKRKKDSFDIYEFYSNSLITPMHKLKPIKIQ